MKKATLARTISRWHMALGCWLIVGLLPFWTHAAPTTPAATINFVAFPTLEVTQGVQNMQSVASGKSVPLVEGKRTYVMLYATSSFATTTANLTLQRAGKTITLNPINSKVEIGPIAPRRIQNGVGRFVFELPSNQLNGTIKLKATLNPNKNMPASETSFTDNASAETTVTFKSVAKVTLHMYDVQYKRLTGKRVYKLADLDPTAHRSIAVDWLQRAYPLNKVSWYKYAIYMGRWANISGKLNGYCAATNTALYWNGSFPSHTYSYGMVSNTGGYMRGCANPFNPVTASGPTGNNNSPDGSFGDDYTGHELGHLLGRDHAAFCGAGIPKSPYPYPKGSISPVETDQVGAPEAIVGYDIHNRNTFNFAWRDVMTYCDSRWPSDLSYKKFFTSLGGTQAQTKNAIAADNDAMDRLLLRGVIDPTTNDVALRPAFVLPDSLEAPSHLPGAYTIVLRDVNGMELIRYPFTPVEGVQDEPVTPDESQTVAANPSDEAIPMLFFHELVPYHAATTRVDILGPNDVLLTSVTAGAAAPTVTLLSPNMTVPVQPDQQELTVNWAGTDPDGDPLAYVLEYSNDNGQTWLQYSDAITETEVILPQENLMAGANVLLRVLASDGIHTTVDTIDTPLVVLNHPPSVQILPLISEALPAPGAATTSLEQTTFAVSQTVTLQAEGYDIDRGSLDQELTWSSNLDGVLGTGHTLSTADLSVGTHTITVTADDGSGGSATAQIAITIVPNITDLPALPDRLIVDASAIALNNTSTVSATFAVHNQNTDTTLTWNAVADQPWLQLNQPSGATPDLITLAFKPDSDLAPGDYTTTVTFTSPQSPQQSERVVVTLTVTSDAMQVFLPFVTQ